MYSRGDHPYPVDGFRLSRRPTKPKTADDTPPQRQPLGELQVVVPRNLAREPRDNLDSKGKTESKAPLYTSTNTKTTNPHRTALVKRLQDDRDIPTTIFNKNRKCYYERLEYLGKGAFGRCYKVKDARGNFYAAKIIPRSILSVEYYKKKMFAEVNIHRNMRHRSIVKLYSCFEDGKNIYLILELCENKTFIELINNRGTISEAELRYYLIQILDACRYMHDNRVVHRDLKPANIFLDKNMECKIGDFGLAGLLVNAKDRKMTMCGTPNYIAPEILFNKDGKGHNQKADLWSVGVLMYNLLSSRHPFKQFETGTNRKIPMKSFVFPSGIAISDHAKDLISRLLVSEPEERLSIPEILQHPFFINGVLPLSIPPCALQRKPTTKELGIENTPPAAIKSPGRAGEALRRAMDPKVDYVDRREVGPLKLASETIPDIRTQFPISQKKHEEDPADPFNSTALTAIPTRGKRRCIENEQGLPTTVPTNNEPGPTASSSTSTTQPSLMERMARILNESLTNTRQKTKTGVPMSIIHWTNNNVFLDKWVDFTTKYGIGYTLSDGSSGVSFNDATTITTHDQMKFQLVQQRNHPVDISTFTVNDADQELHKKISVLKTFRRYMQQKLNPATPGIPFPYDKDDHVYMYKYIVVEHAIVFRLSNNVIQFNFFDSQKVILTDNATKVIYINAEKSLKMYMLMDAVTSGDEDLVHALAYCRDILVDQSKNQRKAAVV